MATFPPALFPDGYGPLEKAYSGNVAGKPRGLLPLETGAEAFFYSHTILRNFSEAQIDGFATPGGFWTIQIRESEAIDSRILFEQSVLLKATLIEGAGGLLSTWFIHNNYTYKFATRIVDGQALPPIIESYVPGFPPPETEAPLPAKPGVPFLYNVKVTSMTVQAPALAERTAYYRLEGCLTRFGEYMTVAGNLAAGDRTQVDVVALFGASAIGSETAPTGRVWYRLIGVNADGETIGDSVRDTFNFQLGNQLVAGYPGYLQTDDSTQTIYSEESLIINEFAANSTLGVRLGADWASPPYKCGIPVGAHLDIISDYWVGQLSNNDIYYSFSFKAGGVKLPLVQDPYLGKTWYFYPDAGDLKVAETRLHARFGSTPDDAVVNSGANRWAGAWRQAGTLIVAIEAAGKTWLQVSADDGVTWKTLRQSEDEMVVLDTSILADAMTPEKIYLLGKATATEVDSSKPEEEQINQGELVRVILKFDSAKRAWAISSRDKTKGAVPPSGQIARMFKHENSSTFIVLVNDSDGVRWFESRDELLTFIEKTGVLSS